MTTQTGEGSRGAPRHPPCIVLGLETQIGLGLVRELGRAGVQVIGLAQDPHALGLASRYLVRGVVVTEPRSEVLLSTLNSLGEEFGTCCLMAVSEANIDWLMGVRKRLVKVLPVLPEPNAWEMVLDKARTLEMARKVGIRVPETVEPKSMTEVDEIAARFRFPAVMKWRDPADVMAELSRHGLPLIKAEYVNSAQEFATAASRYAPIGKWPLVQTYCAGRGLGQFFFMSQGEAVRSFQHLRIAEWPPEGGFSSVCDSVPLSEHRALQELSIELLRRIGWEGVAMVEYRFDERTGDAVLMEINGRFWGSFPLAVHSRAGFALLAYRARCGLDLDGLPPVLEGIRCRMAVGEVKRLVRILFQRGRIMDKSFKVRPFAEVSRFFADYLRPKVRYYVWDFADPGPWFADVRNMLRRVWP